MDLVGERGQIADRRVRSDVARIDRHGNDSRHRVVVENPAERHLGHRHPLGDVLAEFVDSVETGRPANVSGW